MPVKLENISTIAPNSSGQIDVPSDLNLVGTSPNPVYRINGVPLATGGSQTPWLQDIDGASFLLNNVRAIGVSGAAASSADPRIQVTGTNQDGLKCITTVPWGYASVVLQNDVGIRAFFALYGSTGTQELRIQTTGYPINFMVGSNSVTYISATGNVGIGTPGPAYTLDVVGDINVSTGHVYRINGVPLSFSQTPWTSNIDGAGFNLINTGRIGAGITNPGAMVDIVATVDPPLRLMNANPASNSTAIFFRGRLANALLWYITVDPSEIGGADFSIGAVGFGDHFFIQRTTGNVGVGTVNPPTRLSITNVAQNPSLITTAGTICLLGGGSTLTMGQYPSGPYVSNYWMQVRRTDSNVAGPIAINPLGGDVGIGTPAPAAKLDVYGTAIVRADANGLASNPGLGQLQIAGQTNSNQRLYMGFDTTNNCGVIQPGVAFVGWNNLILNPIAGNVGIGTTNPTYRLHVSGARSYFANPEAFAVGIESAGTPIWLGVNGDGSFQVSNAGGVPIFLAAQSGLIGIPGQLVLTYVVNAPDDATAGAAGVPLYGIYHTNGTLRFRTS